MILQSLILDHNKNRFGHLAYYLQKSFESTMLSYICDFWLGMASLVADKAD